MPLAPRSRRRLPVLVSVVLTIVAGCGQSQRSQSPRHTPTNALQPIRYTQTGGLTGTNDRLIISPDGTAVVTGTVWGNRSGRLSAEQIATLNAAFEGWERLRNKYRPLPGVSDAFDLSLTYGEKTVIATDVSDL